MYDIDLHSVLRAEEVSWDVMVASHYYTCCCCRSLNRFCDCCHYLNGSSGFSVFFRVGTSLYPVHEHVDGSEILNTYKVITTYVQEKLK